MWRYKLLFSNYPPSTVNYLTDDFTENVIVSQSKLEDVGS